TVSKDDDREHINASKAVGELAEDNTTCCGRNDANRCDPAGCSFAHTQYRHSSGKGKAVHGPSESVQAPTDSGGCDSSTAILFCVPVINGWLRWNSLMFVCHSSITNP